MVDLYKGIGDLESARKTGEEGKAVYDLNLSRRQPQWYYFIRTCESETEANLLEIYGMYEEAESFRRSAIEYAIKYNSSLPGKMMISKAGTPTSSLVAPSLRIRLVNNLRGQGRIIEAELEARQALKDALNTFGKDSASAGVALAVLGETLLEQNRLSGAEDLIRTGIKILENSGISSDSFILGNVRCFFANILLAKQDFSGAMKQYDLIKEGMKGNQFLYNKQVTRQPYIILALLKTGRIDEAMTLISDIYGIISQTYGRDHYLTAEMQGLRGIAKGMKGNRLEAITDFSEAIPLMIKKTGGNEEVNYLKKQIFKIIIESYIDILAQIDGTSLEKEAGLDARAEIFRVVDALGAKVVRRALCASSARSAVSDHALADLIRDEQDFLKQIKILHEALANNMAMPADQQMSEIKKDLRDRIDTLNRARSTVLDEINARFPRYADFVTPPPVSIDTVQKCLRTGESFLSVYTSEEYTYIHAVPKSAEPLFLRAPIGRREMNRIVSSLRKALDPEPETLGGIPEYDLDEAYNLYDKLLRPVEKGWKDAMDLIVVAQGPLGQIPLTVLPTSPVVPGPDREEMFGNYREVLWLIRKVSVTYLPSTSSLIALRNIPEGVDDRMSFAGFGDPLYNIDQVVQKAGEKGGSGVSSRGKKNLMIRGIRKTSEGNLDSSEVSSIHLDKLNRLPDTADEIRMIADSIGADQAKDVFLGELASERQVKSMDLSDRRVIAFASHALVPGDLDGLDQPAIALSSPSVTGDNEDGLLTMGEILKLKLNADWIVLSACNTGAADGAGAEALSGLGQAFFYAGTRALLASMWPVETTSAGKLTTMIFTYYKEGKGLSRARAHQKSMLHLMDNLAIRDDDNGKIIASYAHPLFWAPFILVGVGG